jgi:hypothetical protein
METIIGLGTPGCNISMKFAQYPQYKTICIDTEDKGYENFIKINKQAIHEDYEKHYTNLDFSGASDTVTFILSGAGMVSGAALRILEQLRDRSVTVVYIEPDLDIVAENARISNRVTCQILQEYARSGVLEKIILVDNLKVEAIVGDVPIREYWDSVNEAIANTVHMINVFNKSSIAPEITTVSNIPEATRILTLGIVNLSTGEEKTFYDLRYVRERVYYYAISEKSLDKDAGLLKKITKQVKQKSDEGTNVSYSIYPTKYDQNYVYSLHYATIVQDEELFRRLED